MAQITRKSPNDTFLAVVNPVVKFLIGRGWGPKNMMVLNWTGRKSGRPFATPVSRFEVDGQLFTTTPQPWGSNFEGGYNASLTIEGKNRPITGTRVADPDEVAQRLVNVYAQMGKDMERAMAITIEGAPGIDEFAAFAAADSLQIIDFN